MASKFPPHVSANNGVLRFKVRVPLRLKPHPVFRGKSYWERSLGLAETAPYQDINDTWNQINQIVIGVAVESVLKARSQKMASKPNMAGEMAPIIPMTNPIHVMAFV